MNTSREAVVKIEVGDIFHHEWGYDQTNADFYQVVSKTQSTVTVRRISTKPVKTESSMSGYVMPIKDAFSEFPPCGFTSVDKRIIVKRPYLLNDKVYLPAKCGCCEKWDGKPIFESTWA